jgi:hypothetical protein
MPGKEAAHIFRKSRLCLETILELAASYYFIIRPRICLVPSCEGTLPVNALGNIF